MLYFPHLGEGNIMKKLVLICLLLSGCATADIVPIGANTYMISQTSAGGIFTNMSKLKSDVILRANAFAREKEKIAIPVNSITSRPVVGGMPSYEYQFTLVDKDDPRAKDIAPIPNTFRR